MKGGNRILKKLVVAWLVEIMLLTFSFAVIAQSFITVHNVSASPRAVAIWQQRNKATGIVNNLGAGNNVNPSENSQVRIKISGLTEDEVVKSVKLYEEDWISADDYEQDLTTTRITETEAVTDWISPPMQTDDPGHHSEWYAIITIGKPDCTGDYEIRTSTINVPDGVIKEDKEVTLSESTIEAGGSVGNDGKIRATAKKQAQRKRVVDFAAAYKDPTVTVELYILSSVPEGWSLWLEPSSFTIEPGEEKSVYLVFVAPTEGNVIFQVRSYISETGLVDETDPLMLVVTAAVGGFSIPIDKLSLLAPYIGLASTVLAATVATVIYVKRIKKREQNNG